MAIECRATIKTDPAEQTNLDLFRVKNVKEKDNKMSVLTHGAHYTILNFYLLNWFLNFKIMITNCGNSCGNSSLIVLMSITELINVVSTPPITQSIVPAKLLILNARIHHLTSCRWRLWHLQDLTTNTSEGRPNDDLWYCTQIVTKFQISVILEHSEEVS